MNLKELRNLADGRGGRLAVVMGGLITALWVGGVIDAVTGGDSLLRAVVMSTITMIASIAGVIVLFAAIMWALK